jgi:uncharacterized RDD family membrane protein YckC
LVPTIHYTLRKQLPLTTQDEILDAPTEGDGEILLHHASLEKRLINYLLDAILSIVLFFSFAKLVGEIDPENDWAGIIMAWVFFTGYPLYYFVFEIAFSGQSPAKFLTGTRAVHISGSPASGSNLIIRSLCRLVPFERFSFLVNYKKGWHDVWSKTAVIDIKKSNLLVPSTETATKKENSHTYLK